MSWKLIRRISAVAIATLAGASAYTYAFSSESEPKLKATPFVSSLNHVSKISPSDGWDYNWDHRGGCKIIDKPSGSATDATLDATLDKQQSKAIRNIILIRHGQFIRNCATEPECILTELGRQQAMFTGQRIAEMELPIENVVVSPLTRAQETSKIIMEQLPHLKDIPMKTEPMIEEGAPFEPVPPVDYWNPPPWEFFQQGSRIEAGFRSLIHRAEPSQEKDSYTMLVCHGNIIRYFVTRALQLPTEAWLRFDLHHASITWLIVYPDGKVRVKLFGDCGHLKKSHVTET